jgi:hypothetical protein
MTATATRFFSPVTFAATPFVCYIAAEREFEI